MEDEIIHKLFMHLSTPKWNPFPSQILNGPNIAESTAPTTDTTDPAPLPYIKAAKKGARDVKPEKPPQIIHYFHERDQ